MNVFLKYTNLSDSYERRARFLPAFLSILPLFPLSLAWGGPLEEWITELTAGAGTGAVLAVLFSHLASAAGNRLQEKIWPDWPHDSPVNRWLNPRNKERSTQQKTIWYEAIMELTGLDIGAAHNLEVMEVINDATTRLRYKLRKTEHADRLRLHNIDYGFARNLTGLRPVWLAFAVISCVGCWFSFLLHQSQLIWCVSTTAFVLIAFPIAFVVLPKYVRQKAHQYAESFFGATMEVYQNLEGVGSE